MWLSLLVGVVAILRWVAGFWSDTAILNRWKLALAHKQAQQQVEAERLRATYQRIKSEPDLTGQALVDKLNETVRKLRPKP